MKVSFLMVILSSIVLCFVLQTWILKIRISESLSAVEKSLQTHQDAQHSPEEELHKVSDIIEESGKLLASSMRDLPGVLSDLKLIHAKQTDYETKLEVVLLKLDKCIDKLSESHDMTSKKVDELAEQLRYVSISFGQFLWFVFGIASICLSQALFSSKTTGIQENIEVFFFLATIASAILLVLYYLWQLYVFFFRY